MRKTIHWMIPVFFCVAAAVCAAQDRRPNPPDSTVTAPQSSTSSNPKEIKTDLERMQVLLGQMQRNVAFVSAGDTPLKHQFELEIEMWQILIQDMKKKAEGNTSIDPLQNGQ